MKIYEYLSGFKKMIKKILRNLFGLKASANLNDYEEGLWKPTITGDNSMTFTGSYKKISLGEVQDLFSTLRFKDGSKISIKPNLKIVK